MPNPRVADPLPADAGRAFFQAGIFCKKWDEGAQRDTADQKTEVEGIKEGG